MKRTTEILVLCLILLSLLAITGCVDKECKHTHTTVTTIEATCTEDGSKVVVCDDCGQEVSRETHKSNGHSYEIVAKREATCIENGYTESLCRRCGESKTKIKEAKGHDIAIKTVEATCEKGKTQYSVCTRCEETIERQILSDPLGHNYEVTQRVEPTLREDGYVHHSCTRCSHGFGETLPALGGDDVDNLPSDLRFDGEEFVIAGWKGGNRNEFDFGWANFLDFDAPEAGDRLEEAAYSRNEEIRQRFGVEISYDGCWNWNDTFEGLMEVISICSLSGQSRYDLITYDQFGYEALIIDELVANVADMPYINLSKNYYNQKANDAYYLRDDLYVLYSDITYLTQTPVFMTVNNDMLVDLGYSADFLVDMVGNGDWTIEVLFDMIDGLWVDLNDDKTADAGDAFGLSGFDYSLCYLYPSAGLKGAYLVDDGFAFDYGTDYSYEVIDRILDLADSSDVYLSQTDYGTFAQGKALFGGNGPTLSSMRDIAFDFDILPYPKYRKEAESYTNLAAGGVALIPSNIEDENFVGAMVEAMASGSAKYMVPAFYDYAVEEGMLPSAFSVNNWKKMLGEWAVYDFTHIVTPDDRIKHYSPAFIAITENNRDFQSSWDIQKGTIEQICQEFYDWYLS